MAVLLVLPIVAVARVLHVTPLLWCFRRCTCCGGFAFSSNSSISTCFAFYSDLPVSHVLHALPVLCVLFILAVLSAFLF